MTAAFFDDSADVWATTTPTNARYRIDRVNGADPTRYTELLGWTSLTPATTNSIAITGAQNAISNGYSYEEKRQVTVEANAALATQYQATYRYEVVNLAGQT